MKPVLLFAGCGEADGGWSDMAGTFDTVDEAKAHVEATRRAWGSPERVWTFDSRIVMSTSSSPTAHRTYEVGDKINGTDVVEAVNGFMVTVRAPARHYESLEFSWAHIVTGGEIVAELDHNGEWSS